MGFFSDLKEDLSQAVNELMPLTDEPADLPEENDVLQENSELAPEDISLEEMLEKIDDIQLPQDLENSGTVAEESGNVQSAVEEAEPVTEMGEAVWQPTEETVEEASVEEAADEVAWEPVEGTADAEPSDEEPAEELADEQIEETGSAEEDAAMEEVPVAWELRREIEQKNSEKESKGAEKKMDSMTGRQASDETAIITAGMEINGDINSEGSIDLVGTVCGNIEILGKLNVTGHINGNSKAAEIYAEGAKINGEIVSEGAVKIGASSVIIGNITATSAAIAGAVKGDIDVKGPVILDASAIVMGNIKSKSVQINNGAVIEGMCSQCYADVSPTSFFDEYKPEIKSSKKSK